MRFLYKKVKNELLQKIDKLKIRYQQNLVANKIKKYSSKKDLKIVVGSGGIYEKGWMPIEFNQLDIKQKNDWERLFSKNSIDAILAEHVWEHLSLEEGMLAANHCFYYLKPGGYIRVAVPDGYHSNQEYIKWVKPEGTGDGSDDHKVLFNYITLSKVFTDVGFKIKLLEYFDENGDFHCNEWSEHDGKINRSAKHDPRNQDGQLKYTSVIIDAIKHT